jgi:hypothetical protein
MYKKVGKKMLKLWLIISCIATILNLLTNIRAFTSESLTKYFKKYGTKDIKLKIIRELRDLVYCWIPILNILMVILFLYIILFASDAKIIEMAESGRKQRELEKRKIEKVLSDDNN